jgi:hypothetical protein
MAGKNHRIGKSLIEIQRSFGTEEKCQESLFGEEACISYQFPEGISSPTSSSGVPCIKPVFKRWKFRVSSRRQKSDFQSVSRNRSPHEHVGLTGPRNTDQESGRSQDRWPYRRRPVAKLSRTIANSFNQQNLEPLPEFVIGHGP